MLHLLLVLNIMEALIQRPSLLQPSFVKLMILVLYTLHKIKNNPSHCHLGVQLDLYTFLN